MKHYQMINAYKTIKAIKMKDREYPLSFTYALHRTQKLLQDQWDFQIEEEKKFADKCHVDQDGKLIFDTEEDARQFDTRMRELGDMDVELNYDKPHVSINENISITYGEMEALADFIDFS